MWRNTMKFYLMYVAIAVLCAVVLLCPARSYAHEAAVITIENGDGVLRQICLALGQAEYPEDEDAAVELAQSCFDWAAHEMWPKPYTHDHS